MYTARHKIYLCSGLRTTFFQKYFQTPEYSSSTVFKDSKYDKIGLTDAFAT